MKTVLDLVGEFARLNDAKVQWGGRLPPGAEKRWQDLKRFYDLLMSQNGITPRPVTRRFSAQDVMEKITARERLRVPVETEVAFKVDDELETGLVVNVSRGGLFLAADRLLPVRTSLTLFLTTPDASKEALIEAEGIVTWVTERGIPSAFLPPGMGIRFEENTSRVQRYLDQMVIDSLVRRLSGVDANGLAPEFLIRERIEL